MKKLSDAKFLADECPQSKPAGMNCPASQGDEPRRGGGGLTPTGTTPDASADNINGSEKEESHSCAWETPPALRATSPTRRRSFASGRTNLCCDGSQICRSISEG